MRKYYEAYDDRYRQAHKEGLEWFTRDASCIIAEVMARFCVTKRSRILEIGCGEGRDARHLLETGHDLTATDVSAEAIRHCREKLPQFAERFKVLDAVAETPAERYDFVYAIAVLHMLVEDNDRAAFLRFVRGSLKEDGIALLCMLGDGKVQRSSDISTAFDLQERTHGQTGRTLNIASTSCRMVDDETLEKELESAGLLLIERGMTTIEEYAMPGFLPRMTAVVVKAKKE